MYIIVNYIERNCMYVQANVLVTAELQCGCLVPEKQHHELPLSTGWLSWLSIGLVCGRLWVQALARPTLRVFKITEKKVLPL